MARSRTWLDGSNWTSPCRLTVRHGPPTAAHGFTGAPCYPWRAMERVFITGIGAVTPLGLNAPATWAAMLEGRSGIDTIAAFDPSPFPVRIAGEVRGFEPEQVAS